MFLYYNKMVIHHKNLMLLKLLGAEMQNSYYSSTNTLPKLTCRRQSST